MSASPTAPATGNEGRGPSAYATWVSAQQRVRPNSGLHKQSEDPHGRLFAAAEHCTRSSLRHLQSLRKTFGLLDIGTSSQQRPGAGTSSLTAALTAYSAANAGSQVLPSPTASQPHIVPSDNGGQEDTGSPCHVAAGDANRLTSLHVDETRQRRLLADMFVAQWKRLHEQHQLRLTELLTESEQARRQKEERRAARSQSEQDAFTSGLAFLRGVHSAGSKSSPPSSSNT